MTNRAASLLSVIMTLFYWLVAVLVWWAHPEQGPVPVTMNIELIPGTSLWQPMAITLVAPNKAGLIATNIIGLGALCFLAGFHYHVMYVREMMTSVRASFRGVFGRPKTDGL